MNGVGVFLGPISDGAAGTAVNLKRKIVPGRIHSAQGK